MDPTCWRCRSPHRSPGPVATPITRRASFIQSCAANDRKLRLRLLPTIERLTPIITRLLGPPTTALDASLRTLIGGLYLGIWTRTRSPHMTISLILPAHFQACLKIENTSRLRGLPISPTLHQPRNLRPPGLLPSQYRRQQQIASALLGLVKNTNP